MELNYIQAGCETFLIKVLNQAQGILLHFRILAAQLLESIVNCLLVEYLRQPISLKCYSEINIHFFPNPS